MRTHIEPEFFYPDNSIGKFCECVTAIDSFQGFVVDSLKAQFNTYIISGVFRKVSEELPAMV